MNLFKAKWGVIAGLFGFSLSFSVQGQCVDDIKAFKIGERVEYEVYYNWGFIWVNAGEVSFSVEPGFHDGNPIYHFVSEGSSKPNYDWLYKVRDVYESKVSVGDFQPLWFKRDTYEGKFKVDEEYHYLPEKNQVAFTLLDSENPLIEDTLNIKDCSFDVITMVYYARTLDFSKYKKNDKIPINVLIDGEAHSLYIRYLGTEEIETRDKKKYNCIKFKPLLVEGSIFQGGEDMTVWVTNDANKVPILVEAKIIVGSIKAYIHNAVGLRNPQTAFIE